MAKNHFQYISFYFLSIPGNHEGIRDDTLENKI